MRFIIGIVVLVLLVLGILTSCKRVHTSTSITKDSTTTITMKDTSFTTPASEVDKTFGKGAYDSMIIGKVYSYFDSLRRAELRFIKDSLGRITITGKCHEVNNTFSYPEKVIHTKETIVKEVVKEVPKRELPFWIKLLIGGLIAIILALIIIILIVFFRK